MIKKIPIPLAGPMLGTAALGSLLQVYSEFLHAVCGWAAAFLLLLLFAKIIRYPEMIADDLQSPVFTGIGATFFMGIMMLILWIPRRASQPFHWSWAIPCISVFLSAADFAYLYALSLDGAMIAIVSMVRRASVIVSFCFAAFVLREKNIRSKALDLGLVILSMALLAIGHGR